jgi:hypothetical protein
MDLKAIKNGKNLNSMINKINKITIIFFFHNNINKIKIMYYKKIKA